MKTFSPYLFGFSISIATALLAACGGSQPPIGAPGAMPQSSAIARASAVGQSGELGKLKYFRAPESYGYLGLDLLLGPDGSLWYASDYSDAAKAWTITRFGSRSFKRYYLPRTCSSCASPRPLGLVNGPDDRIWFGTWGTSVIGAMDTGGNVTYYAAPSYCSASSSCVIELGAVVGPDIWFWVTSSEQPSPALLVGYIDASTGGTTTFETFEVATKDELSEIVLGPDGNIWFGAGTNVERVTPQGAVSIFSTKPAMLVQNLIAGPDGDLWFSGSDYGPEIGRMNISGEMLSELTFKRGGPIEQLIVGPGNKVWVTQADTIIRMKTSKTFQEIKVPSKYSRHCSADGLAIGSNGDLWFNSYRTAKTGRCKTGMGTLISR
jgi:streptogramin lyase